MPYSWGSVDSDHLAVRLAELVMRTGGRATLDHSGAPLVGGHRTIDHLAVFATDEDDDTTGIITWQLWQYFDLVLPWCEHAPCLDVRVTRPWLGTPTIEVRVFERFLTAAEAAARSERMELRFDQWRRVRETLDPAMPRWLRLPHDAAAFGMVS